MVLFKKAQGLDPTLRDELHDVLREVRAGFQTPILMVTHSLEEAYTLADRVFVYNEGKVVQQGTPAEVFERPANATVARLMGIYSLIAADVLMLDPGRNTSQLRIGDTEITGPYLPGKFKGDRVWICVRPEELQALPRDGRPLPNQFPVQLERATQRPGAMRLEFQNDLRADISRADYERYRHNKEWTVEFPSTTLRVL